MLSTLSNDMKIKKICKQCKINPVKLTRLQYCSRECFYLWKHSHAINPAKPCEQCGKMTVNKKYCGKECRSVHLNVIIKCKCCGRDFNYHKSKYDIDVSDGRYCSNNCRARLVHLNEWYFSDLTTGDEKSTPTDKIITLGQIIVTGWHSDFKSLHIVSDRTTLEDINNKLNSGYSIEVFDRVRDLYRINIYSERMVSDLVLLGLGQDPFYQELPSYDFDIILEGIRSTHVYDKVSRTLDTSSSNGSYRLDSSRIGLELSYRLGMRMRSETYKDMAIGRTAIEYIVF